jgi:hypothetical protein
MTSIKNKKGFFTLEEFLPMVATLSLLVVLLPPALGSIGIRARTSLIIVLVVWVIVGLPMWWLIHCFLQHAYVRMACRFCRKRGMVVSRYRSVCAKNNVRTEQTLVELDCVHPQNGRQIVRFVVWGLGIRRKVSIEPYQEDEITEEGQQSPAGDVA